MNVLQCSHVGAEARRKVCMLRSGVLIEDGKVLIC